MRAFLIHHFSARRSGIDVAVSACLIALAADVDLQGIEFPACEGDSVFSEEGLKIIHGRRRRLVSGAFRMSGLLGVRLGWGDDIDREPADAVGGKGNAFPSC